MSTIDRSRIYIPPGIVKDFQNELKTDEMGSRKKIIDRMLELCTTYDEGGSLLYFDRLDRAAMNSAFLNFLVTRDVKEKMLMNLASCDAILLKLRDICSFVLTCDSRATFILKITKFVKSQEAHDVMLLIDCVETLVRWTKDKIPDAPKQNDLFLIDILASLKETVPDAIDTSLHSDFIVDRMEKLLAMVDAVRDKDVTKEV